MNDPETRPSLLIRVRDPADHEAWEEFVEIYSPVIVRVAKRKGLQDADAEDVAQQVFLAISRTLQQRPHDATQARFRTWLRRVCENATLNAITRRRPDQGEGDTARIEWLREQPAAESAADSQMLRHEHQQEVLRWAARKIESEFEPATWQAFWRTTVLQQSCDEVARELGKNVGSIYAARSRVMRRLREKAAEHET